MRCALPQSGQPIPLGPAGPPEVGGTSAVTLLSNTGGYLWKVQRPGPKDRCPLGQSVFGERVPVADVRTGLLVVGTAIAVVGAALFLTVVLAPPTTTQTATNVQSQTPWATGSGSAGGQPAYFTFPVPGALKLIWASYNGSSLDAAFYASGTCALYQNGSCNGPPTYAWTDQNSGVYVSNATESCPCYLVLTNQHPTTITALAVLFETYQAVTPALSTFSYAAVLSGATLLLGIGGLAAFFGLFLRRGVYRSAGATGIPEIDEIEDEEEDSDPPVGSNGPGPP